MRWRFIDPLNQEEAAARDAVVARMDAWWKEFQDKGKLLSALFSRQTEWDLPEWMERHLGSIDPRLMWEFGPAVRGPGHRLVITPEAEHHLRPLVQKILDRAPTCDGWEFYPYRLPEDIESTRSTVEARTGYDITDFKVRASLSKENRIDLQFTSPAISDEDDESALGAAFVATETLLGEECLNHWIGAIEIALPPRRSGLKSLLGRAAADYQHFTDLERLQATVNALIGSVRDQMPRSPHYEWVEDAEWTLWELQPEESDDYEGQSDLFVGKSANPALWTVAHNGGIVRSETFSRCGETFCYVKMDGFASHKVPAFGGKHEMEDALDAVLKPAKLGCQIGGGTGLHYTYIDLALTELDRGIQAVRKRLQEARISKRSWILFYDSDLAAEWVGVYDDSPPPPMMFDP